MNTILPPSKGTEIKISVTAELGADIHMDDVDFECEFYGTFVQNKVTVRKEEMIRIDADEYVAIVDSAVVGTGQYYMRFTAYIPDTDMDDGLRTEVVTIPTGIRVV